MWISEALFDRLAQQGVDQADNRRIVLFVQQVLLLRQLLGQRVKIQFAAGSSIIFCARPLSCW